ncbi:unnamed protein product [Phytophthora fragariaefolia]|uniref:Unnamed protein product n=1 Tax=Phytophthora fragariaefolia TaxID=1490495 RepID=A0A9W6Y8C8_9STRA|nr:unnamed protein product [Phytophthora fragariaefolia]
MVKHRYLADLHQFPFLQATRTSFTFQDDQELVQLARTYTDGRLRIVWVDIAHRMRRIGHTAAALQSRLRDLMRTWGSDILRFPPSFFTEVRRPPSRLPAATRQPRARAVLLTQAALPQRSPRATLQSDRTPGTRNDKSDFVPQPHTTVAAAVTDTTTTLVSTEPTEDLALDASVSDAPLTDLHQTSHDVRVAEFRDDTAANDDENDAQNSLAQAPVMTPPPMSPSTVEQVVAIYWAEVPRAVTLQDQNK